MEIKFQKPSHLIHYCDENYIITQEIKCKYMTIMLPIQIGKASLPPKNLTSTQI